MDQSSKNSQATKQIKRRDSKLFTVGPATECPRVQSLTLISKVKCSYDSTGTATRIQGIFRRSNHHITPSGSRQLVLGWLVVDQLNGRLRSNLDRQWQLFKQDACFVDVVEDNVGLLERPPRYDHDVRQSGELTEDHCVAPVTNLPSHAVRNKHRGAHK